MHPSLLPLPSPSCEIFSHQVFPSRRGSFLSQRDIFKCVALSPAERFCRRWCHSQLQPEPSSSQISVYAAASVFKLECDGDFAGAPAAQSEVLVLGRFSIPAFPPKAMLAAWDQYLLPICFTSSVKCN